MADTPPTNLADALFDLAQDVLRHYDEHPTHGSDCACHDDRIRAIRNATEVRPTVHIPPFPGDDENPPEPGFTYRRGTRAQTALDYILTRATRHRP